MPDGEQGAICITELYKTGSPQFRYNIMDLSVPASPPSSARAAVGCARWRRSPAGATRWSSCAGVNLWPEGLAQIAKRIPGVTDDYFVRAVRDGNRDEVIIAVVSDADPSEYPAIAARLADVLKETTGVRIGAEVVAPSALDHLTGFGSAAKLVRFRDER